VKNEDLSLTQFFANPRSLCCLINPGSILAHKESKTNDVPFVEDDPFPCILFFDSLNMHTKRDIGNKVCDWLNSEWIRLAKGGKNDRPFDLNSFKVMSPRGELLS
jgi:hypothetical protein